VKPQIKHVKLLILLGKAYYLCDSGAARGDVHAAVFAYHHDEGYLRNVLAQAHTYAYAATGTGDCATIQAATPAAFTAINYACGQRGLPYVLAVE
jgi:hypothetical protein